MPDGRRHRFPSAARHHDACVPLLDRFRNAPRFETGDPALTWLEQATFVGVAARAPDLDFLDKPNAMRCDPDFQASFDEVGTPDKGKGWTYGHMTGDDLKDNIRAIKVEKLPPVAK